MAGMSPATRQMATLQSARAPAQFLRVRHPHFTILTDCRSFDFRVHFNLYSTFQHKARTFTSTSHPGIRIHRRSGPAQTPPITI